MTELTRTLVRQIATEEALAARCTLDELLHMGRRPAATEARVRAWARIIAETGCRGSELAQAWGCYPGAIYRVFPRREPSVSAARAAAPRPLYDPRTVEHLRWAHGDARTAEIVKGNDPATEADIAAWRRLGSGA